MINLVHTHHALNDSSLRWRRRIPWIVVAWGGSVAALGSLGVFAAIPLNGVAALAVLGILAPVAVYAAAPGLRTAIRGRGLDWLTRFHLWRIAAAAVFFAYGAEGLLPEIFVRHAAWGDLLAGLLVIPVIATAWGGRARYWAFHTIGFADFVLAVGTGLTLSLMGVRAMDTVAEMPLVLIPLFGVGLSGASHLMAFHLLATGAADPRAPEPRSQTAAG